MPTRTSPWPAGTPCWADCAVQPEHRGMHHATDFYERLFGWRIEEGPKEAGGYAICLKDDAAAAALAPAMSEEQPAAWTVYLATDDLDATLQRVVGAGGQVVAGPMDVLTAGRAAYVMDPVGGHVGLWQAGDHIGYGITGEPDTVAHHTLLTLDVPASQRFYGDVFGWTFTSDDAYGATAHLDGAPIATVHQADQLPDDVRSAWLVHFGVVSRDASAQIAQELDAQILLTFDGPAGPEATIQAPGGEILNLLQLPDA
ncbi:VOC family protein [Calidifontibacter sp. DB0510]|uniref:VOC family protein n=1 Tax=Metallococcus carri TaxID=1656884 RepID=A0A967EG53_9MICO|nr:VOC family protein [Metallococcus carri]NHN57241.1 VOC family protein [Metallococcus carri]NOP37956.1 VOC family protein [Calidifontibacter sp. DB2511S]